jgi:hypothetical protein
MNVIFIYLRLKLISKYLAGIAVFHNNVDDQYDL